jgi:hypothetical protein
MSRIPWIARLVPSLMVALVLGAHGERTEAQQDAAQAALAPQSAGATRVNPQEREGDPIERERYWKQRMGSASPQAVVEARDRARRLPAAATLPPASGIAERAAAPGASSWVSFGPSPIGNGGDVNSGRVRTIAVDPRDGNTVYAGAASGGVWKSTDGGGTWSPMSGEGSQPTLNMGSIAVDPVNPSIIYAGTGEPLTRAAGRGILKSTNGGVSWTLLGEGSPFLSGLSTVYRTLVVPGGPVYAAASDGLVRSSDGVNWRRVKGGLPAIFPYWDVALAGDGMTMLTAGKSGLYRSTDGGATWTAVTVATLTATDWSQADRVRLAFASDPSHARVAYLALSPPDQSDQRVLRQLFFSLDGGASWSPMPVDDQVGDMQKGYNLELAVDPVNGDLVYLGAQKLTATTGGTTGGAWAVVSEAIHFDQHAIAFLSGCAASPCPYYLGNDGGVYLVHGFTGGSPFNPAADSKSSGLTITQFNGGDLGIDFVTDPRAIGGTQDNGTVVFVRNDPPFPQNPIEWAETLGADGGLAYLDHDPGSRNIAYAEYQHDSSTHRPQPFQSVHWGYSWTPFDLGLPGPAEAFYPLYVPDRLQHQHLAFATNGGVYECCKLDPQMNPSWYLSNSNSLGGTPMALAIAPSNSQVIYAAVPPVYVPAFHPATVYRTVQGNSLQGSMYAEVGSGIPCNFLPTSLTIDPGNPDMAYVLGNAGGSTEFCQAPPGSQKVFRTADGGASWTNISGSLPAALMAWSIVNYYAGTTHVLVIGTDAGVFFSTNGDQQAPAWTQFNNGLPNVPVMSLALDQDLTTLAAFTYGRGAFSTSIGGPSCAGSYSIAPASQSFPSGGGSGSVAVTAPAGCPWSAASGASWVTVTSGASGVGNGTVTYSVAPNSGASPQSATLTIAGQTFTVNEAAGSCSGTLTPTGKGFTPQGGSSSVAVTASCAWTAASGASWITITAGGSGTGNGTVFYSVAANATASSRVGTLSIAGQTLTVMQAGGITAVSASASSTWTGSSPAFAIDGDTGTAWNSGNYAPGSIDIDLGASYDVTKVRLNVAQSPSGSTTHEIWGGSSLASLTLLQTLTGVTSSGQWLESLISPAAGNVRFVRIRTTASPSWVAWSEIEVYGTPSGGGGTGLFAQYFNNTTLSSPPALTRIDGPIDFTWGTNGPAPSVIGGFNFSARWTGQLLAQRSEPYTFYVFSDDGVRLWVNGQLLLDRWFDQYGPEVAAAPIALAAGQSYDIQIEYYQHKGGAEIHLSWSSPSTAKQVVPAAQLFPFAPQSTPASGNASLTLSAAQGSYVNVPSSPTIDVTGPFTIEAWVNVTSPTSAAGQAIVERYNWSSVDDGGFALRLTAAGTALFGIIRQAGVYNLVIGGTSITTGWHHLAGVYDGVQLRVYLDGRLDGTAATSLQPASGTASLKVGARGNDAGIPFDGKIDEVRLTASVLYSANFAPDPHPAAVAGLTRGLWRFDARSAQDASGNGNHGTLVNGATFASDHP